MTVEGLITIRSAFGPEETMNRFEAEIRAREMSVFAHIDHAAGAAAIAMPLRPTEVLIFGAAKSGTPLLEAAQSVGIDLPLKALVWQDEAGVAWLSYNDPFWLVRRHGIGRDLDKIPASMAATLDQMARVATGS